MKRIALMTLALQMALSVFSQSTPIYSDDFESYTAGDFIAAEKPARWKTWDNLPGTFQDGVVSTDYASSGTRSVLIDNVPGMTDLVLKLGDRTYGKYDLEWKMFIESGNGGYYNLQHFELVATEWAFEVGFDGNGSGELLTGTDSYPFTYPQGTWFPVKHFIDIDSDWIRLEINGIVVHEWPFSYQTGVQTGTNQMGCVDFYATTPDGSTPEFYIDDMNFIKKVATGFYTDNFESYNTGDFIALEKPEWWKTWDNLPGTYQDGLISDDYAFSGTHSVLIDIVPGQTDLIVKLGDRTYGKYDLDWKMFIESGNGAYYNLQHFEFVAMEWAFDVWFDGNGNGVLTAGTGTYPFTYPQGTWFDVKHFIDIDSDWIRLEINGIVVHEWPFSYQNGNQSGTNQLGCVDFYATTADGSTPEFYIDDMNFVKKVPTGFYTDNFESYSTGDFIALEKPEWWKTWNNLPGSFQDGLISDDYAFSGTHSVLIDNAGGEADLVLKLGDRTSGFYDLSWKMFIEPGNGGYYNLEHYESVGIEWAFDVWFNGDGSGELYTGGISYAFNYPQGTWFQVQHLIDLNNDNIILIINGSNVHHWPFSYQNANTSGTKQLGSIDFYATTLDGSTPRYYIDDMYFQLSTQAFIPLSNWVVVFACGLIALFTLFISRRRY